MDYATFGDLARVATDGWAELAQRSCRDARVTGELLRAVVESGDTSAWPPEVVVVATEGVAMLRDTLTSASRYADNFLTPRYPAITPEQLAASDLPTVVATIAVRRLFGVLVEEDIRKGTAWADDYLKGIADGFISLGSGPATPTQEAETYYEFSPRSITDDDLRGFA